VINKPAGVKASKSKQFDSEHKYFASILFAIWDIRNSPVVFYYKLLLLLTAIGLSPGGSSPTLVKTKIKVHKTTKNYKT
jgi:hypothetical protein